MINDLIIWFLIGAVLLLTVVYIVYKTKAVYTAREKSGILKKKIPLKGLCVMFCFLSAVMVYFIAFDAASFGREASNSIFEIAFYNFLLVTALSLFDALVVDYLLLAVWKPQFLNIPPEVTANSMKFHIKKQFTAGWLLKIPIAIISAAFYKIMI